MNRYIKRGFEVEKIWVRLRGYEEVSWWRKREGKKR